jgi:type II secretory pathway component PulC
MKIKRLLMMANLIIVVLILLVAKEIFFPEARYLPDKALKQGVAQANPVSAPSGKNEARRAADYQMIIQKDIFRTAGKVQSPGVRPEEKIKVTGLNLILKGTVIGEGRDSYAVIMDGSTQKEELYLLNDFVEGARIVRIDPERVIFSKEGGREALLMSMENDSERKIKGRPVKKRPRKASRPIRVRRADDR